MKVYLLSAFVLLAACTSPFVDPSPQSTSPPISEGNETNKSNPTSARDIKDLDGCWVESGGRKQIYTVTGEDTLDLILDVGGSQRKSKVQLKPDGFLVILNQDSLGETLQWVGNELIFKIGGSQTTVFKRCSLEEG